MAVRDWVFGLDQMPSSMWSWSDALKRVARPIFNAYVARWPKEIAEAMTLRDIAGRGIEVNGEAVFPHEEPGK